MGNRSMIVIESEQFISPISLYGHWSGSSNATAVNNVLARTGRIGDPSYLTAQLFHEFSKLGEYDGELSFGIDAFGYGKHDWLNADTVYVNADTGQTSMSEPFKICKMAPSVV
jgi:hypothetical protein